MAATTKPQYQHFVPQFLLRNFSHPYKPNRKLKREKGMFRKDPVVHNLNLLADPAVICEKPVRRILGEMNMYDDIHKPPEQQNAVEKMLADMESRASRVFHRITKAFEEKDPGLWLTRDDRDLVRKFLFLIKYRSDMFRKRFFHPTPEDYDENDQELLREYMSKHGFKRPLDVWFHNIKTIIELEMDPGRKWISELLKRMYPDDAVWFYSHVEHYYMAICTASNENDEFILTDNGYNIFEGPNHYVQDTKTGEVGGADHTPLHQFAPISPKLMIVLRSHVLPNPLEDSNEGVKEWRAFRRYLAVDGVYDYKVRSLLADLPIEKARNNYCDIVGGSVRLKDPSWRPQKIDKFFFKFFQIGSDDLHKINAILLDNVVPCSSVVFNSQESFARTLEWYLTAPCTVGKRITGPDANLRRAMLKKLEKVSHGLGSSKETVQMEIPNIPVANYQEFRLSYTETRRKFYRLLDGDTSALCDSDEMNNEVLILYQRLEPRARQIYELLGGSLETLEEDVTQIQRMWTLRVKIDYWSKDKVDEVIRQRNRDMLLDAYLRLPSRRVWLFVKLARFKILSLSRTTDRPPIVGPEDTIAKVKQLVNPDRLAKLLYTAGISDTDMKRIPCLNNPWGNSPSDPAESRQKYGLLKLFMFHTPGYIENCGIPEVQQLARQSRRDILRSDKYKNMGPAARVFSEGERVEYLTRVAVREGFLAALKGKLEKSALENLKKVMFEIVYPTPPSSWHYLN